MIVCTTCDFQNLDDDAFCGSCGGFLEWTGKQVQPPAAEIVGEPDAPKRGLLSRVQTVLNLDVHVPDDTDRPTDDASTGTPPGRSGAAAPPARPGAPKPPSRPGAGTPPARPGAPKPPGAPPRPAPPGRPAPPRPAGAPPERPSPPTRPAPPRPSPAADDPAESGSAAAGLVAADATAPKPPSARPPAAPRSVAKKSVAAGERTIGAATTPGGDTGAIMPGAGDAVKPQRPIETSKPRRAKPTRKVLAGDLVCGDCGEGNPPSRKFCSRCGTTLAEAVTATTPWWKRLIPRRRQKTLAAGERPWKTKDGSKKRRGFKAGALKVYGKLRPIIAIAGLLAGLLYGVSPDIRGTINDRVGSVTDSIMSNIRPTFVPVAPIEISSTSEVDGFPSRNAIDINTLTTWKASGDDPDPALIVRFDQPIDLERIKLWNGAADDFTDSARIASIHFVFDTGQTFDLDVIDLPDPQDYEIDNGTGVREVELFIADTYRSLSGDDIALSGIEFLVRR